jgi:hypothetical protein
MEEPGGAVTGGVVGAAVAAFCVGAVTCGGAGSLGAVPLTVGVIVLSVGAVGGGLDVAG